MTNIETQAKTAFGKTLHYVTDPVYADALTSLTGKKTINDKNNQTEAASSRNKPWNCSMHINKKAKPEIRTRTRPKLLRI